MAKLTYQSLFQLVDSQIEKRVAYNTKIGFSGQGTRTSISPNVGSSISDRSSSALITNIVNILAEVMPSRIISGLTVKATDPVSSSVTVSAGKGTAGGFFYELSEEVTVPIDFNATTSVFYLNIFRDAVSIETTLDSRKLTIAKIVVPDPSVFLLRSILIVDTKDTSSNAYIQNFTEYKLHGDANGNFEEDTVELLRSNIGQILADNIIGNIRLNENLKITNTSGSLELNSDSLQLLNPEGTTIAKLNRAGTFFYDENGIELAKFASDEARIGNILITKNTVQSQSFISENKGFQITDRGYAEFQDVRVRGRISSSVFEYDKISAVGGKLYVQSASALTIDMTARNDSTLTVEDSLFAVNDVLRIKDGIDEEYMLVTNISAAPTYQVNRDLASSYAVNAKPQWKTGTAIVSTGNGTTGSTSGYLMLDAVSQYAPFLDINIRNSTTYDDFTTKVRLGNLAGITDTLYGTLSGYGLYSDNVYLRGKLYAPDIRTAITGKRIELSENGLIAYDTSGTKRFGLLLSNIGSYGDANDLVIGNIETNNYMKWDDSAGVLIVKGQITVQSIIAEAITSGIINAERIGAGSITANKLSVSTLSSITADLGTVTTGKLTGAIVQTAESGPRVYLDTSSLSAYDDNGSEIFRIDLVGDNIGDVRMGLSGGPYVKWDKSSNKLIVSDIQSSDYAAGQAGYKLSATSGLEINTGVIKSATISDLESKIRQTSMMIGLFLVTDV